MSEHTFAGFPDETFAFLYELRQNNNREWFTANRDRYEAFYVAPALAFIAELGPRLAAELPGDVRFEPRVNGSLFRINRDVRFSRDKTPYKDHLDMWFWRGEKRGWETPGYFMRLMADEWAIGGGMHHLGKEALDAYRAAVVDESTGRMLLAVASQVTAAGLEVGGATRKNVPRGYDAAGERAAYLLHEGLFAITYGPVPAESHGSDFVDFCLARFKAASPINEWLAAVLTAGR